MAEGSLGPENAQRPRNPCSIMPFEPDPDFVDRPDILAWMKEIFEGPTNRVALVGLGGVG